MVNGFSNTVDWNAIQTNLRQLYCSYFHYLQKHSEAATVPTPKKQCNGQARCRPLSRWHWRAYTRSLSWIKGLHTSAKDADTSMTKKSERWSKHYQVKDSSNHHQDATTQASKTWHICVTPLTCVEHWSSTVTSFAGDDNGTYWKTPRRGMTVTQKVRKKTKKMMNRNKQTATETANHYPSS